MKDSFYIDDIKHLFEVCGIVPTIYDRKPIRETGHISPLTDADRLLVESHSSDRGYRRFVAYGRHSGIMDNWE